MTVQQNASDSKLQQRLEAELNRALREAPDNLAYRMDLAVLYDRVGDTARALDLYRGLARHEDAALVLDMPLTVVRQRIAYLESVGVSADLP